MRMYQHGSRVRLSAVLAAILGAFATAGYPSSQLIFNFSLVTPQFLADPVSDGVTVAEYSLSGIPGTTNGSLWLSLRPALNATNSVPVYSVGS